jgi:uncharacterized peroxidase-related enzyme
MSRFAVPTRGQVSAESQEMFDQIQKKIGSVPNLYATLGCSPTALQTVLQAQPALEQSSFTAKEAQAIYLATSQENGCSYCLSAHTMVGKLSGLTQEETIAIRRGDVTDAKLRAVSDLARELVRNRGRVTDEVVDAFFAAGFSNKQFVDLVALVGAKTISNYLHNAADFPTDFPAAPELEKVQSAAN